ncbi:hypothetical protein LBMAG18_11820 [Alphaproteobacteria bacterium]|nr:hypothetical protein LBMAG18_11820 [Alphaproteobacteria bacterium]
MDKKTLEVLNKIKLYGKIKNYLTAISYLVIIVGVMIYIFHSLEQKNNLKIVSDIENKKNNVQAEKIMINPRIILQYNQSEIYNIKATKAFHKSANEIILNEVFAEGDIGKISAGELKISEDGNQMIFTKNPVLILN